MTTVLLIRHAHHSLVKTKIVGRMDGVHIDELGQRQAQKLAEQLTQRPLKAIYTSPITRCRETAAPLAQRLGIELQVCEEANEIDCGDWTNCSLEELQKHELWKPFNQFRSATRIPNGETGLETQARIVSAIERLRRQHENQEIAIVSHGDVIRSALAFYLGLHLDLFHRIEISPASVSIVELAEHGPRVLLMNELP